MTPRRQVLTIFCLGALISLHMANCTQQCSTFKHWANCYGRSLGQVPQLPLSVTHVDLSLNHIRQLNEDSFRGLERLVHLDLGSQRLSGLVIKNNTFRGLHNLTFLHLGDNRRINIETDAFQGLSNLQTLVLLHCDLDERILSGSYLQPLVSLRNLDLFGNQIKHLKPAMFFRNMTDLNVLNISINRIKSICEKDSVAFQGKHFHLMKLSSVHLVNMDLYGFNWTTCGNPFKNMSFDTLDLSLNGLSTDEAKLFFTAILGTSIKHLNFSANNLGSGFGFNNLKDPDRFTFDSLKLSKITTINLSKNFINVLKWSVFRSLVHVVDMSLSRNRINQFERGAFVGLEHLQRLDLSGNLIGEIYAYTFQNLPDLMLLDLTNNHIGAVQHNSFSQLSNLVTLNLIGNSLFSVDQFAQLPSLQELLLSDNKITSKLKNIADNATIIRLDNNRLRNLEDVYIIMAKFPNIVELNFHDNFLSYCFHYPENSIPSSNRLEKLYLSHNALQMIWENRLCLDLFDHLSRLEILDLRFNQLQSLPEGIFKGLTSLNDLYLSYNSLTHLGKHIFPVTLKSLDLSYNFLGSPDPDVFRLPVLSSVFLGVNRFLCDCNLRDFKVWANETSVELVPWISQLQCEFPRELRGVSLSNFTALSCDEDDEQLLQALQLSLFISCSVLFTAITLGSIAYARFRGHAFVLYKKLKSRVMKGQEPPQPDNLQYDVYLCFAEGDFVWVESALLQRLDSQFDEQNQLRCCFEGRDFLPGEDHLTNIRSAIWGSRKTVCVVSKEFLKDGWCLEAFMLAQGRMLQELKDVLVVVVVGSIPHFRLMKYEPIRAFVKNREYLQWPEDLQDIEWFFDRLIAKIFKDAKVKHPKNKTNGEDIELHEVTQVKT